MPNPTPGAVHRDSFLTGISIGILQSSTAFIADRVFPRVPVQHQSDVIATYNNADFLRDEVEKRGPGDSAVQLGYRTGSTSYIASEWAAEHAIDDQVRANASSPFSPEEDATRFLVQKMMIKRDVEFVTQFFSTGNLWTGSSDGQDLVSGTDYTAWSNAASTPIEDVTKWSLAISQRQGVPATKLVVGAQVWADLKNHPDVIDRVKYTSRDAVTTDLVARLMGIDEIVVATAIRNTAGEGLASNNSFIAGSDDALLVHAPANPGLMVPAAGYTFVWSGLIGSNQGQVIERYRDDKRVSDVIRIRAAWAQKRVGSAFGVFFSNASTNA